MIRNGSKRTKCHFCDSYAVVGQNRKHAALCEYHYRKWKIRNRELKQKLENNDP